MPAERATPSSTLFARTTHPIITGPGWTSTATTAILLCRLSSCPTDFTSEYALLALLLTWEEGGLDLPRCCPNNDPSKSCLVFSARALVIAPGYDVLLTPVHPHDLPTLQAPCTRHGLSTGLCDSIGLLTNNNIDKLRWLHRLGTSVPNTVDDVIATEPSSPVLGTHTAGIRGPSMLLTYKQPVSCSPPRCTLVRSVVYYDPGVTPVHPRNEPSAMDLPNLLLTNKENDKESARPCTPVQVALAAVAPASASTACVPSPLWTRHQDMPIPTMNLLPLSCLSLLIFEPCFFSPLSSDSVLLVYVCGALVRVELADSTYSSTSLKMDQSQRYFNCGVALLLVLLLEILRLR